MQDLISFPNINSSTLKMTDSEDHLAKKVKIHDPEERVEYSVTSGHKPLSIIIKRNVTTPLSKTKRKLYPPIRFKKETTSPIAPSNGTEKETNWNDSHVKNNNLIESSSFPAELSTPSKVPCKQYLDNSLIFSNSNPDSFFESESKNMNLIMDYPLGHFDSPEEASFSHLLDSALLTDNSMCDLPLSFGEMLNSPILHTFSKSSLENGPLFANDCNIFPETTYSSHKPSQKELTLLETNNITDYPNLCSFLHKNHEDKPLISTCKLATNLEDHISISTQLDLAPPLLEPYVHRHSANNSQDNLLTLDSNSPAPDLSTSVAPRFNECKEQENLLTLKANQEEQGGFLPSLISIPPLIDNKNSDNLLTTTQENEPAAMNNVLSTAVPNSNSSQMENGPMEEIPTFQESDLFDDNECHSPLLFSDEEEPPNTPDLFEKLVTLEDNRSSKLNEFLMGLPPPKNLTKPQMDVRSMLELYHENKDYHFTGEKSQNQDELPLKENVIRFPKTTLEQVKATPWPQIQSLPYFDIQYNNCLASEQFEALCMKLLERYVGAETASTCNAIYPIGNLGESAKKRSERRKRAMGGSPGTRLSHLARRRQIFSSENMLALKKNPKNQLLIPIKRVESTTRRKASSSKKKNKPATSTRDTTRLNPKRALFQSPTDPTPSQSKDVDKEKLESTSRDLFGTGKRKRENGLTPHKSPKKANQQSGADLEEEPFELSALHQKKLLWATAEALRTRGVNMSHPNFRTWAARLARLCRREWISIAVSRPGLAKKGSTSEKMLALANCHLPSVMGSTRIT